MWQHFIGSWNGAAFFLPSSWLDSESLELHTDASGALGFGRIFKTKCFFDSWSYLHWLSHAICGVEHFQTSPSSATLTASLWFPLSILNGHTYQESWI